MSQVSTLNGANAIDWFNGVIGVSGLLTAIFALGASRRSARAADKANGIGENANRLASSANLVAEQALKIQLDESELRLVVKPRMMHMIGDGEDTRARPVVEVINLSVFPVTIQKIHWKTNRTDKPWLFWKNPTITAPFDSLPARLPPRESLTAVGTPESFRSAVDPLSITAAVVFTACGEAVEGMTAQWKSFWKEQQDEVSSDEGKSVA